MHGISGLSSRVALTVVALALGACSGNPLTTGTLFGDNKEKAAAGVPPPETMTDRVVHVGTTAARAQRCGYVFDPIALRQSYLAFESQQNASPDVLSKAEQSYDYTYASVTKNIAGNADYCSDGQTATIKRDLTNVLAGDFSSPTRKPQANVGWWSHQKTEKPLDREKVFNPVR